MGQAVQIEQLSIGNSYPAGAVVKKGQLSNHNICPLVAAVLQQLCPTGAAAQQEQLSRMRSCLIGKLYSGDSCPSVEEELSIAGKLSLFTAVKIMPLQSGLISDSSDNLK